jgi:hypothetical protein
VPQPPYHILKKPPVAGGRGGKIQKKRRCDMNKETKEERKEEKTAALTWLTKTISVFEEEKFLKDVEIRFKDEFKFEPRVIIIDNEGNKFIAKAMAYVKLEDIDLPIIKIKKMYIEGISFLVSKIIDITNEDKAKAKKRDWHLEHSEEEGILRWTKEEDGYYYEVKFKYFE